MRCPICEKHQNITDLIFENDNWLITHGPLDSQILGYVYIEPKRHVEEWGQFTDEELSELGPLIKKTEIALKKVLPIDRLYSVTISEAVRHLHVHLIPRENEMDVKGVLLIEQATQQRTNENKINQKMIEEFIKGFKVHFQGIN